METISVCITHHFSALIQTYFDLSMFKPHTGQATTVGHPHVVSFKRPQLQANKAHQLKCTYMYICTLISRSGLNSRRHRTTSTFPCAHAQWIAALPAALVSTCKYIEEKH